MCKMQNYTGLLQYKLLDIKFLFKREMIAKTDVILYIYVYMY